MTALTVSYLRMNADELRGTTQADYLINVEGDLRITEGKRIILNEPSFPIAELARSLLAWLGTSGQEDFLFDSMSFEEVGTVAFYRATAGWLASSIFHRDIVSSPQSWADIETLVNEFASDVERDLLALGMDPYFILRK